jgi:CRP-like cAMP-binding protein
MVSPELLRRFPFFGFVNGHELQAVAIIANEVTFKKDDTVLENDQVANALHLVIDGSMSLYYVVTTENDPSYRKEYFVSDVNPGEIFGISALIEPFIYTGTVRANSVSHVLKIDAPALRALCEADAKLAYGLMREVAKAAMHRLHDTRVLLVSARK